MRNEIWVVWNGEISQWQLKKSENETAIINFLHKDSALAYGMIIAQRNEPSQLLIKNKEGKISEERTYGDDP